MNRMNLMRAQQRMKSYADRNRREVTYEVGDWVYLRLQSQQVDEVLIKWQGLRNEATREDYQNIYTQFPSFHLEDKVVLWEGGNVTNCAREDRLLIKYTYSHRGRKDMGNHSWNKRQDS